MTAPKERPLNLTGPEILAVLDGSKVRHTIPIRPQPHISPIREDLLDWGDATFSIHSGVSMLSHYCPLGKVGDLIWCRESFWLCDQRGMGEIPCLVYEDEIKAYSDLDVYHSIEVRPWETPRFCKRCAGNGVIDAALHTCPRCDGRGARYPSFGHKSATNMPRWASRILLEIRDIKVLRVQEISGDDAVAEGIPKHNGYPIGFYKMDNEAALASIHRERFRNSWDSKYGKKPGLAYADNPWAFSAEFRRVKP